MTTNLTIPSVVEETRSLLTIVRRSIVKIGQNLYFLRESGEYEGKFGAYAEEEFGLIPSATSKFVNIYEEWIVKHGFSQEQLEGIDQEKLYTYIPLLEGKTHEQALAEIKTWSRSDIRAEKQEKSPCIPDFKEVCVLCWTQKENHPTPDEPF